MRQGEPAGMSTGDGHRPNGEWPPRPSLAALLYLGMVAGAAVAALVQALGTRADTASTASKPIFSKPEFTLANICGAMNGTRATAA